MENPSLTDQAYLINTSLKRTVTVAATAILVAILFEVLVLGGIINAIAEYARHGKVEQKGFLTYEFVPNDPNADLRPQANYAVTFNQTALINILAALAGTGVLAGVLIIRTNRELDSLRQWQHDYLGQAYLSNLELSRPSGITPLARIVSSSAQIFPQVRYSKVYPKLEEEISNSGVAPSYVQTINGTQIDVSLRTKEGLFFIKYYADKEVNTEDIKSLMAACSKIAGKRIFRIICVAKSYHPTITDPESGFLPDKLGKQPIDLIYEMPNGSFIAIWIS